MASKSNIYNGINNKSTKLVAVEYGKDTTVLITHEMAITLTSESET
jgi:hypothetical protein